MGYNRMKRILAFFLAIASLSVPALAANSNQNGDTIVYITRTGECYHEDGCSYLKSRIEITLERAVSRGYKACSRCSPPRLVSAPPTATPTPKPTRAPAFTNPPVRKTPAPVTSKPFRVTYADHELPGEYVAAGLAGFAGLAYLCRKKK